MRVLIVEQYHHYKVLENIYHLLNEHCELSFYLNKDKKNSRRLLFPSSNVANLIINPAHSSTYFVWLLFIGWKYKYINIATGPEGSHFSLIINILFFYLCCFLYKRKIILTIKNIRPYLESTPGLFSYLRNKATRYLNRFTFETNTMRGVFSENTKHKSILLGVSYDRYPDLNKVICSKRIIGQNNQMIIIGLLGVIAEQRRDYEIILNALKELSKDERGRIKFTTLGGTPKGVENEIIQKFIKYSNIDFIPGWMSAEEFDERGMSCDILISPLRKNFEYGTYKGSGSIGDAIYLKKKIILPIHVDPEGEFNSIGIYYDSKDELVSIFRNISRHSSGNVQEHYYDKFTREHVYRNLIKDLSISDCDNN